MFCNYKELKVKIFMTISLAVIILLVSIPVFADTAETYIENEVAAWTAIADKDGFNILQTYTGEIGSDNITYDLELTPGVYHLYASGGENIQDLVMYIYGSDGQVLNSDALADKIPICVIMIGESATISVEVTAWSFVSGSTKGLFCLLIACEDEGEILSTTQN
jgi:hypothetical protein